MLPELSTRLTKISEQKRLKLKLEGDLHTVETELQAASTRFSVLASQLEKEKVDVEKLEHLSLKALFYSVLGNKEQQLDKERQELLSEQLKYQQSMKQVTFLEQDKNSLIRQLGSNPVTSAATRNSNSSVGSHLSPAGLWGWAITISPSGSPTRNTLSCR